MARLQTRRLVFIALLAAILIASTTIVIHLISDRDLTEVDQVELIVIAPGAEIRIGGRDFGRDRATARLTGLEPYCFEFPETASPSRTLRRVVAGDGEVISEPRWKAGPKLSVLTYPHLYPEDYVYRDEDGHEVAVKILVFRHSEHRRLMGVTVRAIRDGDSRMPFKRMSPTKTEVEDWWHQRVLKQQLTIWRLEVELGEE